MELAVDRTAPVKALEGLFMYSIQLSWAMAAEGETLANRPYPALRCHRQDAAYSHLSLLFRCRNPVSVSTLLHGLGNESRAYEEKGTNRCE